MNKIDLKFLKEPKGLMSTMSIGQWDAFLEGVYASGGILIELDDNELPVALYRKKEKHEQD